MSWYGRDSLNNALILNPGYDEAWIVRGRILEEIGNPLEAERCYEEALRCFDGGLQLDPENEELLVLKAKLLEELERSDEAIDAYAAAATIATGPEPLVRLAALLAHAGRPADALTPADRAREMAPADGPAWLVAGRVRLLLGHAAEALPFLEKAADLGAGPEARLELGRAHAALGHPEDALRALDAIDKPDPEAHLLRAGVLGSVGRLEEALAACDAALRSPEAARDVAYHRKAKLLLDGGRTRDAIRALDAAIGLNPDDEEYWCDAAVAWKALGREDRAARMVERALDLNPACDRARELRGGPGAA